MRLLIAEFLTVIGGAEEGRKLQAPAFTFGGESFVTDPIFLSCASE